MTRCLALALATLTLAACGGGDSAVGDGMDWQTAPDSDSLGAAALFAHFADGTVGDAFERLEAQPYAVTVTLTDLAPDSADTLGVFEQTLEVTPGAAPRRGPTTATGSLADTDGLDPASLSPSNPLPTLITGEAPFLDPSTRGAYRLDVTPMAIGDQFTLRVADDDAERPLIRSATAQRLTGTRLALSVERLSESAIYDEASSAFVLLREDGAAHHLPVEVRTSFQTQTPGRQRRLMTRWTIQVLPPGRQGPMVIDGQLQDSTMNSREP